jgi:hypothetical protein
MIDRKAIKAQEQVDRLVAAGESIPNEGAILVSVVEAGVEKVKVQATVAGTEKIAGVALLPYALPSHDSAMEQFVVPSTGSMIFSLRNQSLVTGQIRAMVVGGADLVLDMTFAGTPAAGAVKIDATGGRIKFNVADAGKVVNFLYKHSLTVVQARQRHQERSINNKDLVGELGQIGVLKGYVEFSTDQYDHSKDYSTGAALTLGDGGVITIGGAGPALPQAKVLALPDLSGSVQAPKIRISMLVG